MKNRMNKLAGKMNSMMICAHAALTDRRGEGYVDTAVKILMAVVIGGLILWKHRGNIQRLLTGTEKKFQWHVDPLDGGGK